MKLISFQIDNREHIGALCDDQESIVDFTQTSGKAHFSSMLALIDGGAGALDEARDLLLQAKQKTALRSVKLRSPLPEPRQIRDFLAFERHVRQARAHRHLFGIHGGSTDPAKVEVPAIWYQQPTYYKANRFSVIGHEEDIVWPSYSNMMDYELEFGAVIGKTGKNISKSEAAEFIFGYTIFNDMSARDAQMLEMQASLGPGKGKDFDTGNVIGPWIVTADELKDPYSLTMIVRVNGEERGRGNSSEMQFRFEDFISHISRDETIRAGEFLGSGTVGNGAGLEFGRFLEDGDVIELEVSSIGVLRNRLVKPKPR